MCISDELLSDDELNDELDVDSDDSEEEEFANVSGGTQRVGSK